MTPVKALIVDDERLARARLSRLLLEEPDVEVVGQCRSVAEALVVVARASPHLVFVDIQMPHADGLQLAAALGEGRAAVVFVTAYEQYAIQAFDLCACDYLLKPVTAARLQRAVTRARAHLARHALAHPDIIENPDVARGADPTDAGVADHSLLVRSQGRVIRIPVAAIDWLEAAGNYVQVHVGSDGHLVRETMAAFEKKLPPVTFARIHRTVIANVDRIAEFQQTFGGDFVVTLRDGTRLRMSRNYRGRIRDVFGNSV